MSVREQAIKISLKYDPNVDDNQHLVELSKLGIAYIWNLHIEPRANNTLSLEFVKWFHDGKQFYYYDKFRPFSVDIQKLEQQELDLVLLTLKSTMKTFKNLDDVREYFRLNTAVTSLKIYDLLI
jgi:hypothetical protein